MSCGIVYVAYGANACREAIAGIASLDRRWPVTVIGETLRGVYFDDRDSRGRWAKLNLDSLSPYDYTLYLDADTRTHGDLSAGFRLLHDGWDLALTASGNQDGRAFWHVGTDERAATIAEVGAGIQLQAGVFFFARNRRVMDFFACWRDEWQRWSGNDQASLVRALWRVPLKLWLLGRPWNGGELVEHRWGMARA